MTLEEITILIVTSGENPTGLQKLLSSLDEAKYGSTANLFISIDGDSDEQSRRIARNWQWKYGEKKIRERTQKLGDYFHAVQAGDEITDQPFVMFRDEDLVAPSFELYLRAASQHFKDWPGVAGLKLSPLKYNVFNGFPFSPLSTGHDAFLIQKNDPGPLLFFPGVWSEFRKFLNAHYTEKGFNGKSENHTVFDHFLMSTGKYLVYPYMSLSCQQFGSTKTPQLNHRIDVFSNNTSNGTYDRFPFQMDEAVIYDGWYEIEASVLKRLTGRWNDLDFEVDLNGVKPLENIKTSWMLSSKLGKKERASFAMEYAPPEINILLNNKGDDVLLARTHHFSDGIFSGFRKSSIFGRLWKG